MSLVAMAPPDPRQQRAQTCELLAAEAEAEAKRHEDLAAECKKDAAGFRREASLLRR